MFRLLRSSLPASPWSRHRARPHQRPSWRLASPGPRAPRLPSCHHADQPTLPPVALPLDRSHRSRLLPSRARWWCILGTELGTPRGRYDEHSSKFSLSCETKVIELVGERTTLPKVDAR
jgi:hypothetical protein